MKMQIVVAALAALAAHGAVAADAAAGAKAAETHKCASCHGADGKTPTDPSYPKIAGQYPDYLLKALNDYHSGARKNAIMGAVAKPLAKRDMQDLAAYFGSLPGPLTHRK
jgi:cytochrome c553